MSEGGSMRQSRRSRLADWHAERAASARLRAQNWQASIDRSRALDPPAHVAADRADQARAFALEEAAFHEDAAALLEGYRGR